MNAGLDLAALIADHLEAAVRKGQGGVPIVGLCGAQGSGKSTAAALAAKRLADRGVRCAVVSLDDVYLTRAERRVLAAKVHPLLATRGPPGTHDLGVLDEALTRLQAGEATSLPVFDKLGDDRAPPERRRTIGSCDVVLLEGWCVGAEPQAQAALAAPINALERDEDPHATWRRCVNGRLASDYRRLFARMTGLIVLRAPSFQVVARWRGEQEATNAALSGGAPMSAQALDRFLQHYERITRHMLAAAPTAADLVIDLDDDRQVVTIDAPSPGASTSAAPISGDDRV